VAGTGWRDLQMKANEEQANQWMVENMGLHGAHTTRAKDAHTRRGLEELINDDAELLTKTLLSIEKRFWFVGFQVRRYSVPRPASF